MESATEVKAAETPPPSSPETVSKGRRPEHSIVSIALMLLLSAGALYLAGWLLRDDGLVIRSWDLTQPRDEGTWELPAGDARQTPAGLVFELPESGFGPKLNLSISADKVRRIQADVTVIDTSTGERVPFAMGWYWARSEDVEASPEEPFSAGRAMVFQRFARHRPNSYRTDIFRHDDWAGTIEAAVFTLKFPESAEGPFRVTLSRLDFLE